MKRLLKCVDCMRERETVTREIFKVIRQSRADKARIKGAKEASHENRSSFAQQQ